LNNKKCEMCQKKREQKADYCCGLRGKKGVCKKEVGGEVPKAANPSCRKGKAR